MSRRTAKRQAFYLRCRHLRRLRRLVVARLVDRVMAELVRGVVAELLSPCAHDDFEVIPGAGGGVGSAQLEARCTHCGHELLVDPCEDW